MKKTLLITSSGPGVKGVGGVLIRDMLAIPGADNIALAALVDTDTGSQINATSLKSLKRFQPPGEYGDTSPTTLQGTFRKLLHRRFQYDPAITSLTTQLAAYIQHEQPEQIWAILNSRTVIDVLYGLLPLLKVDLLLQIWDDPLHLTLQRRQDRWTRRRTVSRFHRLLKYARRTAVIGEEMAASYAQITDGDYVIIRHGIVQDPIPPNPSASNPGEFRIGLSGSMYSPSAWKALQKALDHIDWQLGGRRVVLEVVGGKIEFVSRANALCRFYGWREPEEATQLMRQCDLLYLPQAFEGSERTLTQLSFPTKLSTYAATGRPILVHTPEYGSLTRFCRQHHVGMLCHSLDVREIAAQLRRCEDSTLLAEQAAATRRIGSTILTRNQFTAGVQHFLGITAP